MASASPIFKEFDVRSQADGDVVNKIPEQRKLLRARIREHNAKRPRNYMMLALNSRSMRD
jgi:hypothetical protein